MMIEESGIFEYVGRSEDICNDVSEHIDVIYDALYRPLNSL